MKDNIKIEVNYMLRCHVLPLERRHFKSTWEPAGVTVLSVAPIEIFAGKIVALLNRTAPRDLYDIYNLLKYGSFNESEEALLKKCIVYYSAIGTESAPIEFNLSNIDQVSQQQIKTDLYPVIRNKERFNLEESRLQVKAWLSGLLELEENEWEFLEAFRRKEYCPELLFNSKEILERIVSHPMALWKCSQ